jgi:hypothetical protein
MRRISYFIVAAVALVGCAEAGSGEPDATVDQPDAPAPLPVDDCTGPTCDAIYVRAADGADSNDGTAAAPL